MDHPKLRFAVNACGAPARMQYLPNIAASKKAQLHICCGLSDEALEYCCTTYGVAVAKDWHTVIADLDVDAICLTTTEKLRYPVVELAAQYKKTVYVEKTWAPRLRSSSEYNGWYTIPVFLSMAGIPEDDPALKFSQLKDSQPTMGRMNSIQGWSEKRTAACAEADHRHDPLLQFTAETDKGHVHALDQFVDQILGYRTEEVCGVDDAVQTTRVVFAVIRSAGGKRIVKLAEIQETGSTTDVLVFSIRETCDTELSHSETNRFNAQETITL